MDEQPDADGTLRIGGTELRPGQRIGAYVYLRPLGSGGMALVLLAKDPSGNLIALKVLRGSKLSQGLARFRREYQALAKLSHPNIVRVDSFGDLYSHPYIAMEYVNGGDLHAAIRSFRTLDPEKRWRRCEEVLIDLCQGLNAIHKRGLIHRDLKPSNVLIAQGSRVCKITDFGIVKETNDTDPLVSNTLVGTWAYASPEQCMGQQIDHRSDLYSLGIILFAMLTGKRPFVANDLAGYLELHRDRPAPAPRDINRDIPLHLDEICRKLLQKNKQDRFQHASEVLYRLQQIDRPAAPPLEGAWEPPMVGRTVELQIVREQVHSLGAGVGGVLVLEGDDFSGRTRLLEAALRTAEVLGYTDHLETCTRSQLPFEGLLRVAQALLPSPDPLDLSTEVQAAREGAASLSRADLSALLRRLLEHRLEDGPVVLLLDDLHQLSADELHVLKSLVHPLIVADQRPFLLGVTVRPRANPLADDFAIGRDLGLEPRSLWIGPLLDTDVQALVQDLAGDSFPVRLLARRIFRDTDGSAGYVVAYLNHLIAREFIRWEQGSGRLQIPQQAINDLVLEIPPEVAGRLRGVLDAVPSEIRPLLIVLAVCGRPTEAELLEDVLNLEEPVVRAALEQLISSGLVREISRGATPHYSITSRPLSDLLYRSLVADRRSALHRKVATTLELRSGATDSGALSTVAEHYQRAGDSGRAFRYFIAAARRLADHSKATEAFEATDHAGALEGSAQGEMPLSEFLQLRREMLEVRAGVHYNRGEWDRAEQAYESVLKLADEEGDRRGATEVRLRLATVLRRRGHHAQSAHHAQLALEAARKIHYREGVTEALHCLAALAWAEGRLDECERLAAEGLLVAQGAQLADRRAELLLALTSAQATRGQLAAATAGLVEAEQIFAQLTLKRPRCLALANIAELLTWQGEPVQARQRAQSAIHLARETDYKLGHSAAERAMAVAALDLGLYAEAERSLEAALQLATEIDLPEEALACHAARAALALETQRPAVAESAADQGLRMAQRRDPERYGPLLEILYARATRQRDPSAALRTLYAVQARVADLPVPRRSQVQLALAVALAELGDAEALPNARWVAQTAGSRGLRLMALEARVLLAQLTSGDEAAQHRRVAQELAGDFTRTMSPAFEASFKQRPFMRKLLGAP